jgi:hypothetical protein
MPYTDHDPDLTIIADLPHDAAHATFDCLMQAGLSPVYIQHHGNLVGLGPVVDTLAVAVPNEQVEDAREVLRDAELDAGRRVEDLGRKAIWQVIGKACFLISCGLVLILAVIVVDFLLDAPWDGVAVILIAIWAAVWGLRKLYLMRKSPRDDDDEDSLYIE